MWYDNPDISHWAEQARQAMMTVDREFFLSFTGADRRWAEWLLAGLDTGGYSGVSQLRGFVASANSALDMDRAAAGPSRPWVLSAQTLQAPFGARTRRWRTVSDGVFR